MDRELWKGNMDLLMLSILSNDDSYGYSIISKVNALSDDSYRLSEGTLYSVLKRLERKEFISSYWQGNRKYYTITAHGSEVHKEKLRSWKLVNHIISEVNKGEDLDE